MVQLTVKGYYERKIILGVCRSQYFQLHMIIMREPETEMFLEFLILRRIRKWRQKKIYMLRRDKEIIAGYRWIS